MKRFVWGIVTGVALLVMGAFLLGRFAFPNTGLATLPKPEMTISVDRMRFIAICEC